MKLTMNFFSGENVQFRYRKKKGGTIIPANYEIDK